MCPFRNNAAYWKFKNMQIGMLWLDISCTRQKDKYKECIYLLKAD